jgi:ABC-type amino acid transport substrate-binding protein
MNLLLIKRTLTVSSIIFAMTLGSCGSSSNSDRTATDNSTDTKNIVDKINDLGSVNIGFEPDAPPSYFEKSGIKKGFDYELVKYLSKEVFDGVNINTIENGYDQLHDDLKEMKIDIIAGGRTNEGKPDELYSDAYLSFGYCIITKTSSSKRYVDIASLETARIGVYDDAAAAWLHGKIPKGDITVIGDKEDANTPQSDWMNGLINDEFDVIIYDYPFAANEVLDYANKICISNKNINGDQLNEYVLVINKRIQGAQELLDKINEGIRRFKESPYYSDAIVTYIPMSNSQSDRLTSSSDTYTIKAGETLSILAKNHLGDVNKWREIYNLNKDVLASPDIIYPNQVIAKPNGWQ